MLYGDGTGILANIASNTTNTITVDTVMNLIEGMVIDVVDANTGTAVSGMTSRRIIAINRATKTLTVSGSTMTADAYKPTESQTYALCVQGSYGKELTGLGAIFNNTGSLYGLSRSTYSWMTPYMKDIAESGAAQNISDVVMQRAIDELEEVNGSKVDFIVCSAGVKRNYQEYLNSYRSNVDIMDLAGGYKAISYNGIPLISDRFVKNGTMYLLNTKEFNLHQLCDWQWLEGEDGKVLKQTLGKPTYQATLVKYADIICDHPGGQAKIEGIKES